MCSHKIQFWVPLFNFFTNKDKIEIGDIFVIEKPTSFEKKNIIERLAKGVEDIISSQYLLRTYIKTNKPAEATNEFFNEAIIKFEKAIILFRLYREKSIGFKFIVKPLANTLKDEYCIKNLYYSTIDINRSRGRYKVHNDDIESLNKFFREYDIFSTSRFDLAVNYFNRSYSQHFLTNKFLDTMFVLENLFLRNTSQELKYKLSMRMAYVLGANDNTKREDIFTFIRKCYDIRSQIVHGDKFPKLDMERISKLREYTIDSLKIFFKNKDLCSGKNLDDIILKGNCNLNN